MRVFTTLLSPAEARARYLAALSPAPLGAETVPLDQALDRVLTADLVAGEDLPPFDRSTVDGFAVAAAHVAQGGGSAPAVLRVGGGETVGVPTGGMLPAGGDAVVTQERTRVLGETIEVHPPVRPGENMISRGEDVRAGDAVLRAGRRLRPQDLGILAGLGPPRGAGGPRADRGGPRRRGGGVSARRPARA